MTDEPTHPDGYSRTPTPLPPAPREVKWKSAQQWKSLPYLPLRVYVPLLIFVPFALFQAGFLGIEILWISFGRDLSAKVDRVYLAPVSSRHGPTRDEPFVDYTLTVDGVKRSGTTGVNSETYDQFTKPMIASTKSPEIRIRYFSFGPIHKMGLYRPESESSLFAILALFGMLVMGGNIVTLGAAWMFLSWWLQTRRLCRDGEAVAGKIISKDTSGERNRYFLTHSFNDTSGTPVTAQVRVTKGRWALATEGQELTVLFEPIRPSSNLAYEFGPMEIQSALPSQAHDRQGH